MAVKRASPTGASTDQAQDNRLSLLAAARREFAAHGFAGARVDAIVKRAGLSARMLYHYFGSKERLYLAVLEAAMSELRMEELKVEVERGEPRAALLKLFDFIHQHFQAHPELVSLLSAENLLHARYLRQSSAIPNMSSPVLGHIRRLVERGVAEGSLCSDLDALRLYVLMVALCYFHLSNAHTLSAIFQQDLAAPAWLSRQHRDARTMLDAYLSRPAQSLVTGAPADPA